MTRDSGIVSEKKSGENQFKCFTSQKYTSLPINLHTPEEVPWYGRCDSDVMNKVTEKHLQRRLLEGGKESTYCIVYTVHVSPSSVQNLCPDACLTDCQSGDPSLRRNVLR